MTKTVKGLLCIVLVLVLLIGSMVLWVQLRKDRPSDTQMQEPTRTVMPTQIETTAETEETVPETTIAQTQPPEVPTPGEKRISRIVTFLSEDTFTEETFFYDHAGNIVRHLTCGYNNGEQTYAIDRRYLYDREGMLTTIQDINSSVAEKEFHYDQGMLTGYTYYEIMADEIAYSVTYHYQRNECGDVVRITTTGSDADIWTIGEYGYDELGRCIFAYEQERYGDHDFERRMTYDHSYTGAVVATTTETLFGSETTTRQIRFGSPEYGYIFGPELYEGYSIVTDVNGCISDVKDGSGQTIASLEYFSVPAETENSPDPEPVAPADLTDLPEKFTFSSGAGGWATHLFLESDGSFTGEYHDSDMGVKGDNYPRGTVYICNFEGKFTDLEKVSDYIYSMKLDYLTVKEPPGKIYYEDDIRYIVSEPCGMMNADEFYIYLPGAAIADLPEAFLSWTHINHRIRDTLPSGFWGIYNAGEETGFTAYAEDFFWFRSYTYDYEKRAIALRPSYYDMSSLVFRQGIGAASMILEFPWRQDGQTEFKACDYQGGTGGYDIHLDFNEDLSAVTISVTSLNGIDLSPWGGTADGTFTAEFVYE